MQKENAKEYEFIREGITNIRSCVTSYISFLIGGSGVAFFAITYLSRLNVNTSTPDSTTPSEKSFQILLQIALPLVMSILVTILQMILFYKFLSHNRFAGYGKLLIHEQHERLILVMLL